KPRYFFPGTGDLQPQMQRYERLVGNQDAEAKNLGFSFSRLTGQHRIDSVQGLALPFFDLPVGIDLSKQVRQEPTQPGQELSKLLCAGDVSAARKIVQNRS